MSGKHEYKVLTNSMGKKELMEHAKSNGVNWDSTSYHEGVNWMRFSRALVHHLDSGGSVHIEHEDPNVMTNMLNKYSEIKELHKKDMIPHVRAAMSKLRADDVDGTKPDSHYIKLAYEHLDKNGGHQWAHKVATLVDLNNKINHLSTRISERGITFKD